MTDHGQIWRTERYILLLESRKKLVGAALDAHLLEEAGSSLPFPPLLCSPLSSWHRQGKCSLAELDPMSQNQGIWSGDCFSWLQERPCILLGQKEDLLYFTFCKQWVCVCDRFLFPSGSFLFSSEEIFLLFNLLVLSISNCKCKWLTFLSTLLKEIFTYRGILLR